MTDDELEQRLRTWYRLEIGETEAAPTTLQASLADITDLPAARAFGDRRTFILLAAAVMLVVAAIGSALAIGSGLIRPPWVDHEVLMDDVLIPIFGPCEPTLSDGVLLTFDPAGRQGGGTLETVPRYVLYESGQILRYEWSTATEWAAWWQRPMAPDGVQLLLDSVQSVNLPNCEPIYLPEHPSRAYALTTRADNAVRQLYLGSGLFETGIGTEAAHAAAADLVTRFADPDLGLRPADWIDTDWRPYEVERYSVTASFPADGTQPNLEGWDVTLPNGSTLRTFGDTMPGTQAAGYLVWRCGAVGAVEAKGIVAALDAAPTVSVSPSLGGSYLDLGDGGSVYVIPTLPHEIDCQNFAPLPPPPTSPPDPEVANLPVCDLLPHKDPRATAAFHTEGGWTGCAYPSPSQDGSVYAYAYARTRATSGDEALELARLLFGEDGFVSDRIAGRTVYLNECITSPIPCSPAIAISSGPYFVVVEAFRSDPGPAGLEDRLRTLATAVIETLAHPH